MSGLREAAQQALEALGSSLYPQPRQVAAIAALRAALAEPVQEPVAWLTAKTLDSYMRPDLGYETCSKTDYGAFPVYTAPPQRKPLTEEEIRRMKPISPDLVDFRSGVRCAERAHRIGAQP